MAALEQHGLLLLSDPVLPSVVGIIVGEPLRASWWGHPQGGTIYRVSSALEERPEVLVTKLVAGKVTYVHARLWPALIAVANAREPWQVDGLTHVARWLLQLIDTENAVHTDHLPLSPVLGQIRKSAREAGRELERRLLIHTLEVHTESGAHAKVLETWLNWAERVDFKATAPSWLDAIRDLEDAAERLARVSGGSAPVPWRRLRV